MRPCFVQAFLGIPRPLATDTLPVPASNALLRPFDYEQQSEYFLRVKLISGGIGIAERIQTVTLHITDGRCPLPVFIRWFNYSYLLLAVNEPPVFAVPTVLQLTVPESEAAGTYLDRLPAPIDPEGRQMEFRLLAVGFSGGNAVPIAYQTPTPSPVPGPSPSPRPSCNKVGAGALNKRVLDKCPSPAPGQLFPSAAVYPADGLDYFRFDPHPTPTPDLFDQLTSPPPPVPTDSIFVASEPLRRQDSEIIVVYEARDPEPPHESTVAGIKLTIRPTKLVFPTNGSMCYTEEVCRIQAYGAAYLYADTFMFRLLDVETRVQIETIGVAARYLQEFDDPVVTVNWVPPLRILPGWYIVQVSCSCSNSDKPSQTMR